MQLPPPDVLAPRASALRRAMADLGAEVLLVSNLPNVTYLTGFVASAAALVVAPTELHLVSDARYAQALAARQVYPALTIHELAPGTSYDTAILEMLAPYRGLRVAIEAAHLPVSRYRYFSRELEKRGWADPWVESDGLVESLRIRKDDWEIARIRDGATRLSDVAKCIIEKDLTGRMEFEVAAEVDLALRRAGFTRPAFDTIVAGGPNAALPHARPGLRRIESGELVVLDFGGVLDGYCTDLTRTIMTGGLRGRARQLVELVAEAQAAAFDAVQPGTAPESVDDAARTRLSAAGFGEAFSHGTGHGLGLDVHEAPRVSRRREEGREPPLAAGMILTLEPGIYLPGWGGVRIEDDVLVSERGAEWLTDVPRVG